MKVDKHKAGLYKKFDVRRTDGSDAPGGKHHECSYFVLDLTHDPHAIPAIKAYAKSCKADYPALAYDLESLADGNPLMPYRTHMPPGPKSIISDPAAAEGQQEPPQEPPLVAYMKAVTPEARSAAFLRTYAERIRNGTAASWEIPNTVATTLEDIADLLAASLPHQQEPPRKCKYGDPFCPCQDGDSCNHEPVKSAPEGHQQAPEQAPK